MVTLDRLKFEVFVRLWAIWHCRLRRAKPFMRYVPKKFYGYINNREIAEPARWEYYWRPEGRPWWHMCCNGDEGGWRTRLCHWLECKWRYTDYYNREDR